MDLAFSSDECLGVAAGEMLLFLMLRLGLPGSWADAFKLLLDDSGQVLTHLVAELARA